MITSEESIALKKLLAKVAVSYYHWRQAGFPDHHDYHTQVALFDAYLATLRT